MPSQPLPQAVATPQSPNVAGRSAIFLQATIFFFMGLFVVLLPHSTKGTRHAFLIAFFVWIISLAVEHKRMFEQPLALPLLAYIVLSAISTALSPDPNVSWGYMKLVCYTALVGTLFAQNLSRLSQVRVLVVLLLLSAAAAAAFTAWQYTYGIGVRVDWVDSDSQLFHAGLRPGDVVVKAEGSSVHTPAQLLATLKRTRPGRLLRINVLRGAPIRRRLIAVPVTGPLVTSSLQLAKAKPTRAQGTFRHYGIFAEVLMPMGCLAWALMLGYLPQRRWPALLWGIIFLAITASIFATQTRSALAGLFAGCMVAGLLLARKRARIWIFALLLVLAAAATLWIHHTRGLGWLARQDAGTQYRRLMWQDGMRLAVQHPLFGVGMATIQDHWEQWHLRAFELYHEYWNFHSDYVQLAAERGALALVAWLWFIGAYIHYLLRLLSRAQRKNRFASAVLAGILAGFVAFLLRAVVESALNDDSLVMQMFFLMGVAIAMERMLQGPGAVNGVE